MWAVAAVRGQAAGAEMRHAWASLQRLEEAGRGSSTSRALEGRVLGMLCQAGEGGFAAGSKEHTAVLDRMKALGKAGSVSSMAACTLEGVTAYLGPMTHKLVVQAHGHWSESAEHRMKDAAAAPDAALALAHWSKVAYSSISYQRQHSLPEFVVETACGEGGARLRETIERWRSALAPASFCFVVNWLFAPLPRVQCCWSSDVAPPSAPQVRL
jgi:fermentation-respiration switch protein FrsA (DUF1100 family)